MHQDEETEPLANSARDEMIPQTAFVDNDEEMFMNRHPGCYDFSNPSAYSIQEQRCCCSTTITPSACSSIGTRRFVSFLILTVLTFLVWTKKKDASSSSPTASQAEQVTAFTNEGLSFSSSFSSAASSAPAVTLESPTDKYDTPHNGYNDEDDDDYYSESDNNNNNDDDDDDDDDYDDSAATTTTTEDTNDDNGAVLSVHDNLSDQPYVPPAWIHDYIDFHNAHVAQSGKKQLLNDDDDSSSPTRWMSWYCRKTGAKQAEHCGGVADRIKGMLMSALLAIVDQRVALIQEYKIKKVKHPLLYYLEPNFIRWNTPPPTTSLNDDDDDDNPDITIFDAYHRKEDTKMNSYFRKDPCLYHDNNHTGVWYQGNYFPNRLLRTGDCVSRLWTSHGMRDPINVLHSMFHTLFRFSNRVRAEADRLRGPSVLPNYYMAAHVRTGDGATWDQDHSFHGGAKNYSTFAQCIGIVQNALWEHCDGPVRPSAYVASDNAEAKEYVRSKTPFPETVHTVPDLEIMHIGSTNSRILSNVTGAYDAVWGEFKVLVDSTCVIESESGFSRLAGYLSRQQPRCRIGFQECIDNPNKVRRRVQFVKCPRFD